MPKKELTEKQKKFLEEVALRRKEKVEELTYQALARALGADVNVFDLPYYILQRARQIIEEAFVKVNFKNPKLVEARKEFLKECLKELKANVVVAPPKKEKDETDERDNKCEPVAQEIVNLLLDPEVVFSDGEYFDEILANEESVPLSAAVAGYCDALDEKLVMVISEHWRRAGEKFWGVPKERVSMKMLDVILKKD